MSTVRTDKISLIYSVVNRIAVVSAPHCKWSTSKLVHDKHEVTILDEHFMKPATHCQSQIVIARRPPTETFAKPTDISAAVPQVGHEVSRKKLKWYLQLRWNFRSIHATKELMLSGPFIQLPANGEGWSSCYFNIKSGLHLKRLRNHDLTCSWLKGLLVVLHSIQWGSVRQALRRTKLEVV